MRCIKNLSKILADKLPEETVLLVRDLDEGRRLLTECAREGSFLVGVRAATPLMLAKEVCAAELARKSAPRLMTRGEMQDLLFQCLTEMPEEGFFAKNHVRERKTAEMMLASILELNREGIPPVSGNERLEALQMLRDRWQELKGNTLLDDADLLKMAIRKIEHDPIHQDTCYVTLSSELFPALDRKLIDLLAKEQLCVLPVEAPEHVRVPEACMGTGETSEQKNLEQIRFWRCRGAETEQKAIMRDVLARELPTDDCAIVYLSSDYIPGLYSAAKTFHLPIFMSEGIPMTESTVCDVLQFLQMWQLSDYNAEELRKPILSGAMQITSGRSFCHELRKRNIGWGKDRYDLLLQANDQNFPTKETADEWEKTLKLLFLAAERTGSIEEQKQTLSQIFSNVIGVRGERDALALAMARNLLAQITWLEEGETVLDRMVEQVSQINASTGEREEGSILAVPLGEAFCTGRNNLYFCGMNRFCLQSGASESPILLDEERIRFGLPGKQEQEMRATFQLMLALHQHEGKIVLSYNDYDMERMNQLSPSPVFRRLLGDREATAISCIPEEPLMAGDMISRGQRVAVCEDELVFEEPANQEQPFELHEEKPYSELMETMAFSASSMETALSCPFKFYMQKLIGLYPPSIPERRNDSWLEANEMGTLCHAVLEQYYRDPSTPWETVLETEIDKLKEIRPEGPESAVRADTEKARRMIERAVSWTEHAKRQVVATEKAFGKNANEEPLEILVGAQKIRLSGSIDRIDHMADGSLAILDYKTGAGKSYREQRDLKLQQYLYTLATETMNGKQKVTEGGYLFLKDAADYLSIRQTEEERNRKENTVLSLLNWMKDESRAMTAAPAFEIQPDGSFKATGSVDARKKQADKCSEYCEYAALCPARSQIQIQQERETEQGEVIVDA